MAESNDDNDNKGDGFRAPGITDFPQRATNVLAEAVRGIPQILTSALSQTLPNTRPKPNDDDTASDTLVRSAENVARVAGAGIIRTAGVVQDMAKGFQYTAQGRPKMARLDSRWYPDAPYLFENTWTHAFFIAAEEDDLNKYLDKAFNDPSDGSVEVVAACRHVIAFVAQPEAMRSNNGDETRKARIVGDKDSAFWIVAFMRKPKFGLYFVPVYHFVENALSLGAGREVFGFPKQLAAYATAPPIQLTRGNMVLPANELVKFGTLVPELMNGVETYSQQTVFSISLDQQITSTPGNESEFKDIFRELIEQCIDAKVFAELERLKQEVDAILKLLGIEIEEFRPYLPILLLKQIPWEEDSTRVAYQAIVEARMEFRNKVKSYGHTDINPGNAQAGPKFVANFYGPAGATGKTYPTIPFENLGIDVAADRVSNHIFWLNADYELRPGEVLWEWPS